MSTCTMIALTVLALFAVPFALVWLWRATQSLKQKMLSMKLPALPRLGPVIPAFATAVVAALIVGALAVGWQKSVPCHQSSVQLPKPVIAACTETSKFLHR